MLLRCHVHHSIEFVVQNRLVQILNYVLVVNKYLVRFYCSLFIHYYKLYINCSKSPSSNTRRPFCSKSLTSNTPFSIVADDSLKAYNLDHTSKKSNTAIQQYSNYSNLTIFFTTPPISPLKLPAPPSRPDKNTPHLPNLPDPIHKPPFLASQHFLKAGL